MNIAYIFNHKSFFASHFLPIAKKAKQKNKVKLFCGIGASPSMESYYAKKIMNSGIEFEEIKIHSTKNHIFYDFINFFLLTVKILKFKPDLLHCATPKGIFFGGLVANFLNIKSLVIFNSGMGFLFSNKLSFFERILKNLYLFFLKKIILKHNNKKIVIENNSDKNFFIKQMNISHKEIVLIRGSGIDLRKFKNKYNIKNKTIILPARVIKEKGIEEFCLAVHALRKKIFDWKYYVIGAIDYNKTSNFGFEKISILEKKTGVKFLGFKKNILAFYKKAGIVCLPSYREGLSKTLIEASALGIPIVTTNAIGCVDAVINKKTAELCRIKDHNSLSKKLYKLIKNPDLRRIYSKNAIILARSRYNIQDTIKSNINIYNDLNKNDKKNL